MSRWLLSAAPLAILLFVVTTASAGVGSTNGSSFNGNGLPEYPNQGCMWASAWGYPNTTNPGESALTETYDTNGNVVNYYYTGRCFATYTGETSAGVFRDTTPLCTAVPPSAYTSASCGVNEKMSTSTNHYFRATAFSNNGFKCYPSGWCESATARIRVTVTPNLVYNVSGDTACLSSVSLYYNEHEIDIDTNLSLANHYEFVHLIDGEDYTLVFDNGAYYDFTCTGDEIFDYDACIYVYGYTCGVDNIKLYKDDSGWVLDASVGQAMGYDVYEMLIVDGEDYKITFIDSTIDGDIVVHNQTFSCTGDNVLIDFDRCNWIYPPNGPPLPIYIWTGYDYNIVIFKDNHGNMVENSKLSVYDKTDNQYLQRWTDASDGYTLLGARFDTDHDVLLSLRTFDGIFTLDTTYPANGSAPVGEEVITTTNWTIPIKYNLNVLPVDQYGVSIFDVFCGLSEYTPLNPGAFWGMDLSDQGYVPVTNCSGFAMCDIIAEKAGYVDYKVEALNWTSKSALVKDYRHNVVMEEE